MTFVAYDVCRIMTFVSYDVCRNLTFAGYDVWCIMMFVAFDLFECVAYRVCRSAGSSWPDPDWRKRTESDYELTVHGLE